MYDNRPHGAMTLEQFMLLDLNNMNSGPVYMYFVHSFPNEPHMNKNNSMQEFKYISGNMFPVLAGSTIFANAFYYSEYSWSKGWTKTEFSLKDANILPNDYNHHYMFLNRDDAENYFKGITERRSGTDRRR